MHKRNFALLQRNPLEYFKTGGIAPSFESGQDEVKQKNLNNEQTTFHNQTCERGYRTA